jgi:hypothetical protein
MVGSFKGGQKKMLISFLGHWKGWVLVFVGAQTDS